MRWFTKIDVSVFHRERHIFIQKLHICDFDNMHKILRPLTKTNSKLSSFLRRVLYPDGESGRSTWSHTIFKGQNVAMRVEGRTVQHCVCMNKYNPKNKSSIHSRSRSERIKKGGRVRRWTTDIAIRHHSAQIQWDDV